MARNFKDLEDAMPPESRARAHALAQKLMAEMPLHELRQARRMSQEALAKTLGAKQASISKLERRTDMYVSSLREYVAAMGGELEIIARCPDGVVRINQFEDLEGSE